MNRIVTLTLALCAAAVFAADKPLDADHAAKIARGLDVFKQHVRPVLIAECLKCHGGEITEAEFDLRDRDGLLKGGHAGPAIKPGDAKNSILVRLINHTRKPHMPEDADQLPVSTRKQIEAWVDLGAPYDRPLIDKADDRTAWTRKVITPEQRQHWAYQPLQPSEPPTVKGTWAQTPIDRFILARLESATLVPNATADRRTLMRRVTFGVTGLSPTPAEIDDFLKDTRPDAFARVVDRLLAARGYGERWGRHWLDLARFAESHGFEHDYDRPTAYPYRDFVIRALNDDLPFDRFVKWQIAGDELAPTDPLALTATGFLGAGVHSTQITKNEVEKHRYDEMDDTLATVGTAMLGLTIGCARCHDHKFDAIPQRDYYRLLSVFTATIRSEVDVTTNASEFAAAKAKYDAAHAPFTKAVADYEREQLPQRFAAWEAAKKQPNAPWVIVEMKPKSAGGATFARQSDGSFLVGGSSAANDTYTFVIETKLPRLTGLRLEALTDPSLKHGGPGRADNGNFALSDLTVTTEPLVAKSKALPVKLTRARATFEQQSLPVAAVIDGDAQSAWAVDPQFGKSHAAAFDFVAPIIHQDGTRLTLTLKFNNNTRHSIGRPRLSLTDRASPGVNETGLTSAVAMALATPTDKRSPTQTALLLAWFRTQDADWQKLDAAEKAHAATAPQPKLLKALICSEGLPAIQLHTQGGDFLPETHFLRRGDTAQKEGVAKVAFLQSLMPTGDAPETRWLAPPPPGARTSFRRTALANWLTDVENGAGRLLARVIVNRLWQHHLGRGIVGTPSDFGLRGEKPTHPELLDWLASELIRNGWKLKPIHRLILTSAVYQQSSQADTAKLKTDPNNALWSRHPSCRLEGEAIRDAILSVSGLLDPTPFGKGTLDPNSRRRSVYFTVKRSQLMPMLQVFDAPDASGSVGERPTTTIAPQALWLLNNPQVRTAAVAFAKQVDGPGGVDVAVREAYQRALGRLPSPAEATDALAFVRQQEASYRQTGKQNARTLALADFCQTLFCLNEFVYVD